MGELFSLSGCHSPTLEEETMRIWKFVIQPGLRQEIAMPTGALILDAQLQNGECCLWALCDPVVPRREIRRFSIYTTGESLPEDPGKYVATFQVAGGLVFHVFEV